MMTFPTSVRAFDSAKSLCCAVEGLLRTELERPSSTPTLLLLSGGNTPLPVYRNIAATPSPVAENVHLGYTDERYVPADSAESNYGNSRGMIEALGLPFERVHRVHTDFPIEDAARRYHESLGEFLDSGGAISLGILGIGPDGHTCSLFSQADLDRGAGRYASATYRTPGPNRVTVTPGLLKRVDRIILLAAGEEKAAVLAQLIRDPASVTAGKAVMECRHVEVWRA